MYTDATKVHQIGHEGTYFSVPGAHLVEPSRQRTLPVLFQAGTSPAGSRIRRAQCRIGVRQRPQARRAALISTTSDAAVAHGRRPDAIRQPLGRRPDRTDAAAQAKVADLARFHDLEAGLVLLSALSGVDWSGMA